MALGLAMARHGDDQIEILSHAGPGGIGRRLARSAKRKLGLFQNARRRQNEDAIVALAGPDIPISSARVTSFDVVGPFARPPFGLKRPWLGYIPDVQHRWLPHLFSARERAARDHNFRSLLANASGIVVNAASVAQDLLHFYQPPRGAITSLPFSAAAEPWWFETRDDPSARYGIDAPFFLCSNQFWRHKNHRVLLAAVALARQEGQSIRVAFTGQTSDYRHPEYYAQLLHEIDRAGVASDVHMLGFIPKAEQLDLMRRAIAVVQPSLFEGGPGGGAIFTAIAFGCPTVVSDLPVNREIENLVSLFFDPHDPADLLQKLRTIAARTATRPDPANLLSAGLRRRREMGAALRAAFAAARDLG